MTALIICTSMSWPYMMALIILHANAVVLHGGLDNFARQRAVWTNKVVLYIYYMRAVAVEMFSIHSYVPLAYWFMTF